MKRTLITLEAIAERKNLVAAFHKAAKGKRHRRDVQAFLQHFDTNLNRLGDDIRAARLPYGKFRAFQIHDPKKRLIHAACFEDRIFHHALMNLAGDVLERAMMPTSYACRPNMGVKLMLLFLVLAASLPATIGSAGSDNQTHSPATKPKYQHQS